MGARTLWEERGEFVAVALGFWLGHHLDYMYLKRMATRMSCTRVLDTLDPCSKTEVLRILVAILRAGPGPEGP